MIAFLYQRSLIIPNLAPPTVAPTSQFREFLDCRGSERGQMKIIK
jgi:hypothetical protein